MKRCCSLLNGIDDIIGRSDLADRAIFLTLAPIGEDQRRSETELWREFKVARPAILGALLDAAAQGLKAMGSVHLDRLPRMADFALWATACETALWPPGTFTRAYTANRKAAIEGIIGDRVMALSRRSASLSLSKSVPLQHRISTRLRVSCAGASTARKKFSASPASTEKSN